MCTARMFSQGSTSLHSTFIWTGSSPSTILGVNKPQALSYSDRLHPSAFARFDTIPECDRRTDGQTDKLSIAYTTLAKLDLPGAIIKIRNKSSRVNFNRDKNDIHC